MVGFNLCSVDFDWFTSLALISVNFKFVPKTVVIKENRCSIIYAADKFFQLFWFSLTIAYMLIVMFT